MRFLITVSSLTPGSGLSRYIFSLAEIMQKRHDVWVLTTHNSETTDYELNELRSISPEINLVSLGGKNKVAKYFSFLKEVRKIKPNVIVCNYNGVTQMLLPFISRKIKIVHILHNDTDDFYRIASINAKLTDGWIAPTRAIADHFNRYTAGKYADSVAVISHGVQTGVCAPKASSEKLRIVYAGVLYEHKGVKILPKIVRKLKHDCVNFQFTILGGGELDDWLRNQFNEDIQSGLVEMTGVVNHDEVYRRMHEADIFLYPTHLDAFGLVIAEAMMNGAVPVVTHLQGITDNLIDNGKNGFLLPQDDVSAFVEKIEKLNSDRNLLKEMSVASRTKAEDKFSISCMSENYLNYFDNNR